ncbi:unnamed protein product [Clavelina lepadiformis]|uniref:Uncharacterized protein n=1 Tax=Clavelina lepadiformis TaxID=159417 RepID=A0ABP0FJ28_CLALP
MDSVLQQQNTVNGELRENEEFCDQGKGSVTSGAQDAGDEDHLTSTGKKLGRPKGLKSEAKQVCGKISRLLRDKQSNTRGSCMFRKRRRRSEKFAIVGYGTQPVDDDTDTESSLSDEESEPFPWTSTDDEIDAYDRPGPNNVLEQNSNLNCYQQLVHNQMKHLVMDTAQMKGKGAKLFAKRQRRMEKYVLEGPTNNGANYAVENGTGHPPPDGVFVMGRTGDGMPHDELDGVSFTPVTFNDIHAGRGQEDLEPAYAALPPQPPAVTRDQRNFNNDVLTRDDGSGAQNQRRRRRSRPRHRMPYVPHGNFASADWSTDDESFQQQHHLPQMERQLHPQEQAHSGSCAGNHRNSDVDSEDDDLPAERQRRFRGVKPPAAQNPLGLDQAVDYSMNEETTQFSNHGVGLIRPKDTFPIETSSSLSCGRDTSSVAVAQAPVKKVWASVKFAPKNTNDKPVPEPSTTKVAYPFQLSPSKYPEGKLPPPMKSLNLNIPQKKGPPSPSIHLLQEPIPRTPSPFSADPASEQPIIRDEEFIQNAKKRFPVHGDLNPTGLPVEVQQSVQTVTFKDAANNPAQSKPQNFSRSEHKPTRKPTPTQLERAVEKPKVAACLKLLDPTRGKYEPKLELVYKQTPSIGNKLDEENRSPSRTSNYQPQQFNKPTSYDCNQPQASYVKTGDVYRQVAVQPQALGSIAGQQLKGKGAKMFEKQQKRMDRYTKESNGVNQPLIAPLQASYSGPQVPKVPGESTKANMSQVLGEFRKVSDSESPKRPSATRRGRSRDPFHYQQHYVMRRPPSAADFVCVDDVAYASDTSSMTSFDRDDKGSTSSSGKLQTRDDVFQNVQQVPTGRGPPPKVAPKPKIQRMISTESNTSEFALEESGFSSMDVKEDLGASSESNLNETGHQSSGNTGESYAVTQQNALSMGQAKQYQPPDILTEEKQTAKDDDIDESNKKRFDVWSPGQPTYEPPNLNHLPPPPSYNEVTSHSALAPKPKFKVTNATYETFLPGTSSNKFDVSSLKNNLPAIPNARPVNAAPCPKPTFSTKTPVAMWQPSSK